MEVLIYVCLGASLTLLISIFRQNRTASFFLAPYWVTFLLLGLVLLKIPEFNWLFVLLLLQFVRLKVKFLFEKSVSVPELTYNTIWILLVLTATLFSSWRIGICLGYFTLETFFTLKLLRMVFREKGISLSLNPGNRINGLLRFTSFNILLGFGLILFAIGNLSLEYLLVVYVLITIEGVWEYMGSKKGFETLIHTPRYQKSHIDAAEKYRLITAINEQFRNPEFTFDSSATISKLAGAVNANIHQVSQVINETRNMNFNELLAFHRIQKAKQLLLNPAYANHKIESIAEEVGYLSKSSFNTSFKKITGYTPSEWKVRHVRDHDFERLESRESQQSGRSTGTFEYIQSLLSMYSNFFKIYFRNVLKNRTFSFINYMGLTVGMVSVLLIGIYLRHELSYDQFHSNAEDIYRIELQSDNPQTRTWHPMPLALVRDFPEVIAGVSLTPIYGPGLTLQSIYTRNPENNVMYKEKDAFMVDSTFFSVFDFKLISGNEETALKTVGGVIITETLARKYFGDEDPMGKALEFPRYDFTAVVNGIMEDPPTNSHFHPSILISYVTRKARGQDEVWFTWDDPGHHNYIKLAEGASPRKIEDAMAEWLQKYMTLSENDIAGIQDRSDYVALTPITDIHLRSHIRWELEQNSNIIYVYILTAAIFLLIAIAAINFINLSTARAIERAKEVGIRKTLGAHRKGIFFEFQMESILTSLVSMVAAFGLAALLFNTFKDISGQPLEITQLFDPLILGTSIVTAILIGALAGIYPSLILSRVKASEMVKGKYHKSPGGSTLQKGLIMVQFGVAAVMVSASIIVLQQIRYMEEKSLGFDDDQIVVIDMHNAERTQFSAFKNEIEGVAGVIGVGGLSNLPGSQFNQNVIINDETIDEPVNCSELRTDFEALQLLGIQLHSGRWFERSQQLDSSGVNFIINRAAANRLLVEEVVGEQVIWDMEGGRVEGNIIGVIEDFHYKSLHQTIQPMVIQISFESLNYLLVKLSGQNVSTTLARLEEIHASFDSEFTLDFSFLDESIQKQYDAERKAFTIFYIFAFIALILSTVGLIGLANLMVTQKTREIGIRKVLGAHLPDIIWLENKPFLIVVMVSLIIGLPGSYIIMEQWMSNFAYRVTLGGQPFLITGVILLFVSVVSVTLAVVSTAIKSPSTSLRSE